MLTTLRKILQAKGVHIQETVYCRARPSLLDYPMKIGDFFVAKNSGQGVRDFELANRLYSLAEEKKKTSEYENLSSQLQRTLARLKEMKAGKNHSEEFITEKLELRRNRQSLEKAKSALEAGYFAQALEEIKKEGDWGYTFLEYKDSFYCSSFAEIASILPQIEKVNTPKLKEMPLFVRGIRDLSISLKKGEALGIVGGPCLFGAYEVIIDIFLRNAEQVQFDFSTGRIYDKAVLGKADIESFMASRSQDIVRLELSNFKAGVTYQEYLSMQYLFEFAAILGARVAIPIPDISYMKFFAGITKEIADEIKEPALKAFERIAHDISDRYLQCIDELKQRYPGVECQVLHSRNPGLCDLFYDRRQQYASKLPRLGRVTEHLGRTDAVIDYITMLALPYYVYGTRHVLQIDSVDEADSMRKCIKIHNPDVSFFSLLFPEYISEDGINTIFNAALEYKQYI